MPTPVPHLGRAPLPEVMTPGHDSWSGPCFQPLSGNPSLPTRLLGLSHCPGRSNRSSDRSRTSLGTSLSARRPRMLTTLPPLPLPAPALSPSLRIARPPVPAPVPHLGRALLPQLMTPGPVPASSPRPEPMPAPDSTTAPPLVPVTPASVPSRSHFCSGSPSVHSICVIRQSRCEQSCARTLPSRPGRPSWLAFACLPSVASRRLLVAFLRGLFP